MEVGDGRERDPHAAVALAVEFLRGGGGGGAARVELDFLNCVFRGRTWTVGKREKWGKECDDMLAVARREVS